MTKALAPLARIARRNGWRIEVTGGGHLKWCPPNGHSVVYTSSTPSDMRAIRNIRSRLRRSGLSV